MKYLGVGSIIINVLQRIFLVDPVIMLIIKDAISYTYV